MMDRCPTCGGPLLGRIEGQDLRVKCSELECDYQAVYTPETVPVDLAGAFEDPDAANWQRLDLMG